MNDIERIVAGQGAGAVTVCPRCNDRGTWVESKQVGRDGFYLIGGPCRCFSGFIRRQTNTFRAHIKRQAHD